MALAILDVLTVEEVADAIALQDKASVARANGVGQKACRAHRARTRRKPAPKSFLGLAATPSARARRPSHRAARAEAVSALVNLGIDQTSAARAVASAVREFDAEPPAPELIRAALKQVSR